MDAAGFCTLVLLAFPSLRKDFEEWNDLLHVQVGEFLLFTQRAIEARSFETVSKCFEIANAALIDGDDYVRNAIYVSFLEGLDFRSGAGQYAFQLMPAGLKKGHEEMLDYLEKLRDRKLAADDR